MDGKGFVVEFVRLVAVRFRIGPMERHESGTARRQPVGLVGAKAVGNVCKKVLASNRCLSIGRH